MNDPINLREAQVMAYGAFIRAKNRYRANPSLANAMAHDDAAISFNDARAAWQDSQRSAGL